MNEQTNEARILKDALLSYAKTTVGADRSIAEELAAIIPPWINQQDIANIQFLA
jgi:hypothetical protein